MSTNIEATIVFEKIWAFIHEQEIDGTQIPRITVEGRPARRYKYLILEGSSRSSKTRSAIQSAYLYCIQNNSKRWSVFRNTKKTCKDTVGKDMRGIYPFMPHYKSDWFNKTDYVYTFPNTSTIEIAGTDEPDLVHGYNGHVLWCNEPYRMSKETFNQLDQRTEDFVIIDWNPKEAHWIEDLKKDERALVIHSTFRHNPFCPIEQKIKILSYQPVKMCYAVENKILTEQEAKNYDLTVNEKKLNDKILRELSRCKENERKGSANQFNWSVYGLGIKAEKPNRIFFWNEISDDDYNAIDAVRYYGVDWGTVDPWGIIEAKYYDGALYLKELNYASENEIRQNLSPEEVAAISRKDSEDNESGLVVWMFDKLKIPKNAYVVCDTNRPLKIRALFEAGYDSAMAAPKPPGSIIDGIDLLNDLRVLYTSSSTNIKYEQENYERKVDRYGKVMDEPEDGQQDHLCDPARYIALFLFLQGIIRKK